MGHSHTHDQATGATNRRRLIGAMCIVGTVLLVEVVGAVLSGSLALLADAGHMLSDFAGLTIALIATVVAARPATDRSTFGFQRAEVFGALINAIIPVGVSIEAVGRLVNGGDEHPTGGIMLLVAAIGLIANVVALLLLRPAAAGSINMKGAYLEVLGDLLGSIAVIIAAVVILTTGFGPADAIASLVIAAMIVPRALVLLKDVVHVLSESAPRDTDVARIREHILGQRGVVDVHDVHVWSITTGAPVFTAHVVVEPEVFSSGSAGSLLDDLSGCLSSPFDVAHSTFQLEPAQHSAHETPVHP
jgi:cobalt-zinc-cadmium efflux system protein